MRPIHVLLCPLLLALVAACATQKEPLVAPQPDKDDILAAVFIDYISNMPAETSARGRKSFYLTAGREDISPALLHRLKRRWPTLISRDTFDRTYGNLDATWGYYGAEIKIYSPTRAVVETWSSRAFTPGRYYTLEKRGEAWLVKSSEINNRPLNLKTPRNRPAPSPPPIRPFYPLEW